MLLRHLGRPSPSLYDIAVSCAEIGAFDVQGDEVGGLYYAPFVDYIGRQHDIEAEVVADLPILDLVSVLESGRFVFASVHSSIRYVDREPPRRGGHLVLAYGVDANGMRFNNPSGHTPATRQTSLPVEVFQRFYAERGILI